jgi:hypothetical protein
MIVSILKYFGEFYDFLKLIRLKEIKIARL